MHVAAGGCQLEARRLRARVWLCACMPAAGSGELKGAISGSPGGFWAGDVMGDVTGDMRSSTRWTASCQVFHSPLCCLY